MKIKSQNTILMVMCGDGVAGAEHKAEIPFWDGSSKPLTYFGVVVLGYSLILSFEHNNRSTLSRTHSTHRE